MSVSSWINFLRHYGPIPRNDNMYDETIRRSAVRSHVEPIQFEHPAEDEVLACFDRRCVDPVSVILTGTAGDGKTHLCRRVWEKLEGDSDTWATDDPHVTLDFHYPANRKQWPESEDPGLYRKVTIHFIRDLSGWAPQQGLPWEANKEALLQRFCSALFYDGSDEVFLIAANDGQLVESWRRLADTEDVIRARNILETLLVEDKQRQPEVRLNMFNLSRWNSAELFDRVYDAFVNHLGWASCYKEAKSDEEAFGSKCPIRRNYEILKTPLVFARLRALIELCDHNGFHLPLRQLLLIITNGVSGHADCNDHLLKSSDVPKVLANRTDSKANLYNNLFGGNLSETRREGIVAFDYFDRFQLGFETSNRIDNILIFGEGDAVLGEHFKVLIENDPFYSDGRYFAARDRYIEGADDDPGANKDFLELLVAQRRGLFFKIPEELSQELKLWDLTVFRFAGEYLTDVVGQLRNRKSIKRPILSRLIKGLNRMFTGMLINTDRELLLATSANDSQARVSRVLVDAISVEPRHGEGIDMTLDSEGKSVRLNVHVSATLMESLQMNLIRYEFVSRVATEGALPASFSKECYEDLLAFKSRLLALHNTRRAADVPPETTAPLRILNVSSTGLAEDRTIEILS